MPADAELWHQVTRSIRPLRRSGPAATPPPMPDRRPADPPASRAPRPPTATADSGPPAAPPAGLDRGLARRLRRGEITIEARIDLHGLTRDEAHAALNRFLARSRRAGRRCVLVITGKGGRRAGSGDDAPFMQRDGPGVLRSLVPDWLETGENRARVLAYRTARPGDGGDGAFYVLLRRRRPRRAPKPGPSRG